MEVKNILLTNSNYIIENNYYGWDPYDLQQIRIYKKSIYKGSSIIAGANKGTFYAYERKAFFIIENLFPLTCRKIFRLKPQINYKALGLLGSSFILQYKSGLISREVLDKCLDEIIEKLLNNDFLMYPGMHWGYPFDWQSKIFIPMGTPSGVVTSFVGNFFLDYRSITESNTYDHVIIKIADFFVNGLNISFEKNNEICFSYTPLDNYTVHNANLLVAEYLIKVGTLFKINDYVDKAIRAANYSINRINSDGSIFYSSDNHGNVIDNYHTGFIIQSLKNIDKLLPDLDLSYSLRKLYKYYIGNFFHLDRFPKLFHNKINPIDIHSVAVSILILSSFRDQDNQAKQILQNIIELSISKMYKNGYFFYRMYINSNGKTVYKIKIPYLRWGQAWMNYALSNYLQCIR